VLAKPKQFATVMITFWWILVTVNGAVVTSPRPNTSASPNSWLSRLWWKSNAAALQLHVSTATELAMVDPHSTLDWAARQQRFAGVVAEVVPRHRTVVEEVVAGRQIGAEQPGRDATVEEAVCERYIGWGFLRGPAHSHASGGGADSHVVEGQVVRPLDPDGVGSAVSDRQVLEAEVASVPAAVRGSAAQPLVAGLPLGLDVSVRSEERH